MTPDEAIARIERSRGVHQAWVDYYAHCAEQRAPWRSPGGVAHEGGGLGRCSTCQREAAIAGDAAHHAEVIREYGGVIDVLRTVA